MTAEVVWDGRWVGNHGIARHAAEVGSRLAPEVARIPPGWVKPASAIDPAYLRLKLHAGRFRTLVSPGFSAALQGDYRQLLTVHDLIHLRVPAESSKLKTVYYERVVRPAIRQCGRVMTVSEFTRAELTEWAGLPSEGVIVAGNGCSIPLASDNEIARADSEGRGYALTVSNTKPHKNLDLVFEAMRHLPDEFALCLVGVPQGVAVGLSDRHGISHVRVRAFTGVSDETLRILYLNAACVAFPSTYEGFGLPALEGMAAGVATAYLCEAVAEVVGELGFRASRGSGAEGFAEAMLRAGRVGAQRRKSLVDRARGFSWSRVASVVAHSIEEIR